MSLFAWERVGSSQISLVCPETVLVDGRGQQQSGIGVVGLGVARAWRAASQTAGRLRAKRSSGEGKQLIGPSGDWKAAASFWLSALFCFHIERELVRDRR